MSLPKLRKTPYSKISEKNNYLAYHDIEDLFHLIYTEYKKHLTLERNKVIIYFSQDYFVDTSMLYDIRISDRHHQISNGKINKELKKRFANINLRYRYQVAFRNYKDSNFLEYVGIIVNIKAK